MTAERQGRAALRLRISPLDEVTVRLEEEVDVRARRVEHHKGSGIADGNGEVGEPEPGPEFPSLPLGSPGSSRPARDGHFPIVTAVRGLLVECAI